MTISSGAANAATPRLVLTELETISLGSDSSIDFKHHASQSNGNGVYKNDDSGLYYYRGVVDNNIIYANRCWQIMGNTADGAIKLLYNGTPSDAEACENTGDASAALLNVKYGDSNNGSYVDSNAKQQIDAWFEANLSEYADDLADIAYCNDTNYTAAHQRITADGSPTFACAEANQMSVANGKLDYPIAMITADELMFSGAGYAVSPAEGEETIRAYKWRIHYAIPATDYDEFKELEDGEILIDGEKLVRQIYKHPDIQWIWGYFQAFEKNIPNQKILMEPPYDLESNKFCNAHYALPVHLEDSKSSLEIEIEDGSYTFVITPDEKLAGKIKKIFPDWKPLEDIYHEPGYKNFSLYEFAKRYNFHDSSIVEIDYDKKKHQLRLIIEFCYWDQEWYKKSEKNPEGIGPLGVTFCFVDDYAGPTGECDYEILDGEMKNGDYQFGLRDTKYELERKDCWTEVHISAISVFVREDPDQALPDNRGDSPDRLNRIGAQYYLHGEYENAIKFYEESIKHGGIVAKTNLGYCYLYGRGMTPDIDKAMKLFEEASKAGDIDATYKLADIYSKDKWGKKDEKRSIEYLRRAADKIDGKSIESFDVRYSHYFVYCDYPSLCLAIGKLLKDDDNMRDYPTAQAFLRCAKEGYEYQIKHGAEFYKESLEETKKLLRSSCFKRKKPKAPASAFLLRLSMQELAAENLSLDWEDDEARENVYKDAVYLLTSNKEMTYEYINKESQFEDLGLVSDVLRGSIENTKTQS